MSKEVIRDGSQTSIHKISKGEEQDMLVIPNGSLWLLLQRHESHEEILENEVGRK